jgi:hypothetical protein
LAYQLSHLSAEVTTLSTTTYMGENPPQEVIALGLQCPHQQRGFVWVKKKKKAF